MSGEKVFRHFLEEMTEMENSIEGNKKIQKMCIKQLIQFIQSENLKPKQIDDLPFPIAFFERNGLLVKANRVLAQAACIAESDLAVGHINFLNRITTENDGVMNAAERVFKGETGIVRDLVAPISMFVRDDCLPDCNDDYQTALFFPVSSNAEYITCGAIVLMRQRFD